MTTAFLGALAAFLGHLLIALALVGIFAAAYMRSTPHDELLHIRSGNMAATIGFVGALIGYAIVLSRAITVSHGIGETLVWGLIALIVQVGGHFVLSKVLPQLYSSLAEGQMSAGLMQGGLAISLGLLNAASMTP